MTAGDVVQTREVREEEEKKEEEEGEEEEDEEKEVSMEALRPARFGFRIFCRVLNSRNASDRHIGKMVKLFSRGSPRSEFVWGYVGMFVHVEGVHV